MKLRGIVVLIGIACLLPAGASAGTQHGIVVGKQHGLLLVAAPNGIVRAVSGHAAIGARLVGTRVVGHATKARIHGIVVERVGTTMFLSSNRHLLAVRMPRVVSAASSPALPTPGTVVNTTVGVKENGELEEQDEDEVGNVNGTTAVQATVTAVGPGTVTLTVGGMPLTVHLPAGLTLPASFVGQMVTINVSLKADDDQAGDDNDANDDDANDNDEAENHPAVTGTVAGTVTTGTVVTGEHSGGDHHRGGGGDDHGGGGDD